MGETYLKTGYINYIIENTNFFEDGLDYYQQQSCSLPTKFKECAQRIRDFEIYEDDVFVLSFPKCDMQDRDKNGTELFDDDENAELVEYMRKHAVSFNNWGFYYEAEKCLLPGDFRALRQRIRDFEVHNDDTWEIVYLKTGSQWTREMIWLVANDLDYKGAEVSGEIRFPLFEFNMYPQQFQEGYPGVILGDRLDLLNKLPRPRFIKSHLPLKVLPTQMLEKKPKIVTVLRDPRDVAVSWYHFIKVVDDYSGTAEKSFEAFRKGLLIYGDYWHHVASLWKLRNEPNVLVLTYEDMKKDLAAVINRTAAFYGKKYTADQVEEAVDYLSIAKMRENDAFCMHCQMEYYEKTMKQNDKVDDARPKNTSFIRKGIVGDHKNSMSEDVLKEFDNWIAEMKGKFGLADDEDFPY